MADGTHQSNTLTQLFKTMFPSSPHSLQDSPIRRILLAAASSPLSPAIDIEKDYIFTPPCDGDTDSFPAEHALFKDKAKMGGGPALTDAFTETEIHKFYDALPEDNIFLRLAFMIMRYTGCCPTSIAREEDHTESILQWQDIDFANSRIQIPKKHSRRHTIPLHKELMGFLLRRYIQFGRPVGNIVPYYIDLIKTSFKNAFRKSGIKREIDPIQGLRQSAVMKLLEAGATAQDIGSVFHPNNIILS